MGKGSKKKKHKKDKKAAKGSAGRAAVPASEVAEKGAPPADAVTSDAELSGKAAKKAKKKRKKAEKARKDAAVEPVVWSDAAPRRPGLPPCRRRPVGDAGLHRRQGRGRGGHGRAAGPARGPPGAAVRRVQEGTGGARCSSSSRAWTPPARAASCATSSAPWTRRACASRRSRRRPRRSAATPSSGGSAERCPARGEIGVFDRSHYEDVLDRAGARPRAPEPRGRAATPRSTPSRRWSSTSGTTIVKVMLHISRTSRRRACRAPRAGGQALEVPPRRPRRARRTGPTTWRPTRRRSRGAPPTPRRGSSCPPTRSGTPASR